MKVNFRCETVLIIQRMLILFRFTAFAPGVETTDDFSWEVNFKYAPKTWRTLICFPDDWQKTQVNSDGALLYEFQRPRGFETRLKAGMLRDAKTIRQELLDPRIPVVRTVKRSDSVELTEEAFAMVPAKAPGNNTQTSGPGAVERIGSQMTLQAWVEPSLPCTNAFKFVALGYGEPVRYRFGAVPAKTYTLVLGFCEGEKQHPGERILNIQIEGSSRRKIDLVKEFGYRVPGLIALNATDENADGWIDLAIAAAKDSADQTAVVNVLWLFEGESPPRKELLTDKYQKKEVAYINCGFAYTNYGPPRYDLLLLHYRNLTNKTTEITPTLTINSRREIVATPAQKKVCIDNSTTIFLTRNYALQNPETARQQVLCFEPLVLSPQDQHTIVIGVARGWNLPRLPENTAEGENLLLQSIAYWRNVAIPYNRIHVPDPDIQAIFDACLRNIYQIREVRNGEYTYLGGPSNYRGFWILDGAFQINALSFLGQFDEARSGIRYLMNYKRRDGAFMLIANHWKETGIALQTIVRHARLSGDKQSLREIWPRVEHAVAFIRHLRNKASGDPKALHYGLIPPGNSDGGLWGLYPEFTNVYWSLTGLRAAVDAARWLGKTEQADHWQREFRDFYSSFRKSAQREMRIDSRENPYLPTRMGDHSITPQKAQWGFLHGIYPGKLFSPNDPLVRGNMVMLKDCERQGLVYGTGWNSKGVWTTFASFYGHAWLWLGDGLKAAQTLYAFANHMSPLWGCWEEQGLGHPSRGSGDMPHNGANPEFICFVRNLLLLERGKELHLFEGLPPTWVRAGCETRLEEVPTDFGIITVKLQVAPDGKLARFYVKPPRRDPPEKIVLHTDTWTGQTRSPATIEIPVQTATDIEIPIKSSSSK